MAETPGTHVGPTSPTSHRMLSEQGNPQLGSLTALLHETLVLAASRINLSLRPAPDSLPPWADAPDRA